MIAFLSVATAAAFDIALILQKSSGRALGGHFVDNSRLRRLLRRCCALIQATLKVNNASFQLLHAPTLPVDSLEKAVECLPDVLLTHDPCPSSFTGGFNLLFHT
jgi:hypothetical protein